MAVAGGVQPVDGLHRDAHSGVEAEGVVGRIEVVVDGLRHADDPDAGPGQPGGHAQRVLAADRDQGVDAELLEVGDHPGLAALERVRIGPGGAEDRAAAGQDAADPVQVERHRVRLEHPAPAVLEPDDLVTVLGDPLADHRADDGVQAGAVPAAGEDSDAHVRPPGRVRARGRLLGVMMPQDRRPHA